MNLTEGEIIDKPLLKELQLMKENAEKLQQTVDNYTKEIWRLHQLEERLDRRIELHKQIKKDLEEVEKHYLDIKLSDKEDMFRACQSDVLNELQKIKEGDGGFGWTPKHTEIVIESEKKFNSHTKDQEVDI